MLNAKAVRPELVTVLASLFLLVGFNLTLWQHVFAITDFNGKGLLLRGAFAVMLFLCVQYLPDAVCLQESVKAGIDRIVHDQCKCCVFHERIRCDDRRRHVSQLCRNQRH